MVDILRAATPCIILDVPHMWTAWTRRVLVGADDIALVASPDLANLRNAKVMMDVLRQARPNDRRPKLIINMAGMPKRPEIAPAEFAKALDCEAANNGQMIAEVQPNGKIAESFLDLARVLIGRVEVKKSSRSLLAPLLTRLSRKG